MLEPERRVTFDIPEPDAALDAQMRDAVGFNENEEEPDAQNQESIEDTYEGPQLGLGDFVFFATLIGKASLLQDMNVIFFCYIALIFGFFVTFLFLIMSGRALPALPVSLIFGLIMYFTSSFLVSPMYTFITKNCFMI